MERRTGIHKVKLQSYLLIPNDQEDRYVVEVLKDRVTLKMTNSGGKEVGPYTFDSSFYMEKRSGIDSFPSIPEEFFQRLESNLLMVSMGYASTIICYFPQRISLFENCNSVAEKVLRYLFPTNANPNNSHSCSVEMACYELFDSQVRDLLVDNSTYRNLGISGTSELRLRDTNAEGQLFVDGVTLESFPDYESIHHAMNAALSRRMICIGGKDASTNVSKSSSNGYKTTAESVNSLQTEFLGVIGNCIIQFRVTTTDTFSHGDKTHTLNKSAVLSVVFLATNDSLLSATEFKGLKTFTEYKNCLFSPTSGISFVSPPSWLNVEDQTSRNSQLRNALKAVATLTRVVNALVEKNNTNDCEPQFTTMSSRTVTENDQSVSSIDISSASSIKVKSLVTSTSNEAVNGKSTKTSSIPKTSIESATSKREKNTAIHVPFRDSLLTRLLKPSLEGNCFLSMVTIPPDNFDSASRALRFASQISQLHNIVWIKESLEIQRLISIRGAPAQRGSDITIDSEAKAARIEEDTSDESNAPSSFFDSMINLMKDEISLLENDLENFERARELMLQQISIALQPVKSYEMSNIGKTTFVFPTMLSEKKTGNSIEKEEHSKEEDIDYEDDGSSSATNQLDITNKSFTSSVKSLTPLSSVRRRNSTLKSDAILTSSPLEGKILTSTSRPPLRPNMNSGQPLMTSSSEKHPSKYDRITTHQRTKSMTPEDTSALKHVASSGKITTTVLPQRSKSISVQDTDNNKSTNLRIPSSLVPLTPSPLRSSTAEKGSTATTKQSSSHSAKTYKATANDMPSSSPSSTRLSPLSSPLCPLPVTTTSNMTQVDCDNSDSSTGKTDIGDTIMTHVSPSLSSSRTKLTTPVRSSSAQKRNTLSSGSGSKKKLLPPVSPSTTFVDAPVSSPLVPLSLFPSITANGDTTEDTKHSETCEAGEMTSLDSRDKNVSGSLSFPPVGKPSTRSPSTTEQTKEDSSSNIQEKKLIRPTILETRKIARSILEEQNSVEHYLNTIEDNLQENEQKEVEVSLNKESMNQNESKESDCADLNEEKMSKEVEEVTSKTSSNRRKRSEEEENNDENDEETRDDDGLTVLERRFLRCVATCNIPGTLECIDNGVDIHVKNTFERDAMQIAARHGSVPMLALIHQHGGHLLTRGPKGDTLLHLAAYNGNVDTMKWLLQGDVAGASRFTLLQAVDRYGQNVVHIAARRGELAVLRYLYDDSGIGESSFTQEDFDGRLPVECIPRRGPEELQACRDFFANLGIDEEQNLVLFFAKLHGIHGD